MSLLYDILYIGSLILKTTYWTILLRNNSSQ